MLFQNFDKVLHFGAFALLSTLAYYAVSGAYPLISTILIPSVVGGLVEYFQSKLPYRKASIADFIADLAGCITVFLAFALYRRYCASREHRHRN
ncbi:VanZ family protein [bacterium]|nr:VanZ family protein [bacterium]